MREKKYAGILDEYVEETKEIQEEAEEKLSMTRELKFKDLQDKIDTELIDDTAKKEAIDLSNTDTIDVPIVSEKHEDSRIGEVSVTKIDDVKQLKDNNDDLYLTTSFKPFRKRFRLKKVFKVLFILVLLVACGAALIYFVILPFYNMYQDSRPKAIFEGSVDYIANGIINVVDEGLYENESNSIYEDITLKIDTNIPELSFLSSSTLGYRYAVNSDKRIYEEFVYVKDGNDKYGISYIERDGKAYGKVSSSDNYILYGDVEDKEADDLFYQEMNEYLDSMANLNKEDITYYIEKERDVFKELLDDKYISFEKDELEINGEELVVIRNSFSLDAKAYIELSKKYNELMLKDNKYLEILAHLNEMSVEEVKETYFGEVEEVEDDYSLVFNIYTINGTTVVGFDIEENGFRDIYAYFKDGNFDIHLNLTDNEECLEGKDCVLSDMMVIDLIGVKKDTYIEVNIEYNEQEIAKLEVRNFDLDKIDFDYIITYEGESVKGDFLMVLDLEKSLYYLDLSCKYDESYINLNLNLDLEDDSEFGYIDNDKVIEYTDKKFEDELNVLGLELEELGLLDVYDFWYSLVMDTSSEDIETGDILQNA